MASTIALIVALVFSMAQLSVGSRRLMELYETPPSDRLRYHQGGVLRGDIPVSILWYGKFTSAQKSIVSDFLLSLNSAPNGARGGRHGASSNGESTHIWVGNSVKQCPGQCAWPFAQPQYGPQGAPLVAPNGDVGMDGMVMVVATMVAGTVSNPYGDGYYQGPKGAGLEACTACQGVYGSGAYPGYAGKLLVDATTGGSYNANGAGGKKYLLPALYDPATSSCNTLV